MNGTRLATKTAKYTAWHDELKRLDAAKRRYERLIGSSSDVQLIYHWTVKQSRVEDQARVLVDRINGACASQPVVCAATPAQPGARLQNC